MCRLMLRKQTSTQPTQTAKKMLPTRSTSGGNRNFTREVIGRRAQAEQNGGEQCPEDEDIA